MTSRERVISAINHQEPDAAPIDLGASYVTGINASTLYHLRKELKLIQKPVTVQDPYQMLGMVDEDVRKALGVDVVGLWNPSNSMGLKNENWTPWNMPDGTPVLMPGGFAYDDKNGSVFAYPQGDKTVGPSLKMPAGGFFFDCVERSGEIDEDNLDPRGDFKDDFTVFDDYTAKYLESESKRLYEETDYAIFGNFGGGGFGDAGTLPAPFLKSPGGIRKVDDWLAAHILYPDYITEVFELQAEIAIENLKIYKDAVGERIQVIYISGTDFGTQKSEFISPEMYRKFYKPFNKRINDWVHKNTGWKTFYHTCGSIINLLDDLIEAGVDIVNPVQCSAAGMDPLTLKHKYGSRLVFWGGAVDTQRVLPFGTPEEVAAQASERNEIFSKGGGFVFSTIHNIVGNVPPKNIVALYETVRGKG